MEGSVKKMYEIGLRRTVCVHALSSRIASPSTNIREYRNLLYVNITSGPEARRGLAVGMLGEPYRIQEVEISEELETGTVNHLAVPRTWEMMIFLDVATTVEMVNQGFVLECGNLRQLAYIWHDYTWKVEANA